jgi:hypothetical protein
LSRAAPLRPLARTLARAESWLSTERVPHVFIGGVAVALVGEPRVTKDVDAVVLLGGRSVESLAQSAGSAGFAPRSRDFLDFARRNRVVLFRDVATNIDLDISLGALPFEAETIRRARRVKVSGLSLPIATPEDIAIMKIVASRTKDLVDIAGLLTMNPRLDLRRVRKYTRLFAGVLEMPELVDELESIVARQRGRTPRRR